MSPGHHRHETGIETDVEVAMRVVFVHGACVRDGAWWWHRTAELLAGAGGAERGPSAAELRRGGPAPAGAGGPGLPEDVAAVRRVLQGRRRADRRGRPQLRRYRHGGSRGRNRVGAPPAAGLQLPARGRAEPVRVRGTSSPAPFLDVDPDAGTFGVLPRGCSWTRSCRTAIQKSSAQAGRPPLYGRACRVIGQPVRGGRMAAVALDLPRMRSRTGAPPPPRQREFARRASRVVELDTGHHPFLSQPAAVRDLLLSL